MNGRKDDGRAFKDMAKMAMSDDAVRKEMVKGMYPKLFSAGDDIPQWFLDLLDDRQRIRPTIPNIRAILRNDPKLRGGFRADRFSTRYVCGENLPWKAERGITGPTQWGDSDASALREYLEMDYGITARGAVDDAVVNEFEANPVHPVQDYFLRQGKWRDLGQWDGRARVDLVVTDFLGAPDTPLNRAMIRKWLVAAVARVFEPGCKVDYCLVLTGGEGIGKSSFFETLCPEPEWYLDNLQTLEGDKAKGQLRGRWIVEFAELSAMYRTQEQQVKAFITTKCDTFRPPYGHWEIRFPRQCVLCGSTNNPNFLKGDEGQRRWWPIQVDESLRVKYTSTQEAMAALARERDQVWAEAYQLYLQKEPLYLDEDLEREARKVQDDHNDRVNDGQYWAFLEWLDIPLPVNWDAMGLSNRIAHYNSWRNNAVVGAVKPRDWAHGVEFALEYLAMDERDDRAKKVIAKVNGWLRRLGWTERTSRNLQRLYNKRTKVFFRPGTDGEDTGSSETPPTATQPHEPDLPF